MIFERKKYLDELQAKCLIQLPSTIPFTYIYEIMYFKLRICLPTSTKPFTLMNVKY